MPRFGPISRSDLIRHLRELGFEGPYSGRKHQIMAKGDVVALLPNPHGADVIGKELLSRVLRRAQVSRGDWEKL